jgi:hypothetical protein
MSLSRAAYRARQFREALWATPTPDDLSLAGGLLSPAQLALFGRMSASEQAHSARVCRLLQEQGQAPADLLTAALLHDCGKALHPLSPWERAIAVALKALVPGRAQAWAQGSSNSWRKPFVAAANHPEWGARLAEEAGCSALTAAIIRRHQEARSFAPPGPDASLEDRLLYRLQQIDDQG